VIVVDTSVWVDHLRVGEPSLVRLLDGGKVLGHPWVIGEIALGGLPLRHEVIRLMTRLPPATLASHGETMTLIDRQRLSGIGYVDAQLLAATLLTGDATLWTRDRRLRLVATGIGCAFNPPDR